MSLKSAIEYFADVFGIDVDSDGAAEVATKGALKAVLAATVITADGTVNNTALTGLDKYLDATILLTISAKTMDASTTLDIYVQCSPDEGTSWRDLAHFAQVTSAAMADGKYVLFLTGHATAAIADAAISDGALGANTVVSADFCDRLRVKTVAANFAGADTITIQVDGYFK